MCFSAEASFAVGLPLIPAGAYCVWAAALKKPSFIGLAVIPICFSIQQISEGFVWLAMEHSDAAQTRAASLVYLFFALAFWPWWFSVVTAIMEPIPRRKWIFAALGVVTTVWFWILYYPLLVGPESLLGTQVLHHSIRYRFAGLPIYQYVSEWWLRGCYFLSVAAPPLLASETGLSKAPMIVLGASAVMAAVLFDHAFVSVWCFFGAILSIYLCVIFYRLSAVASVPQMEGSQTNAA